MVVGGTPLGTLFPLFVILIAYAEIVSEHARRPLADPALAAADRSSVHAGR